LADKTWTGRTAVVIGSGPSLTAEDCELVRLSGNPVIVTNTTFRACPWADAVFAFDSKWWKMYHREVFATFAGRKISSSPLAVKYGVEVIPRRHQNSGVCATAWAMDQGAARVVLLGFDCSHGLNGETHWHGSHPTELNNTTSIFDWPRQFAALAKQAAKKGIEIVNASRETALTCFPRVELESVL
jgi:hypothetical protein